MSATSYEELLATAQDAPRVVRVSREGSRAIVRMDAPQRLNSLDMSMTVQLNAALATLAADPEIRAIVLTGTDPAFCAGGDLRLMRDEAHPIARAEVGDEGAVILWRFIRGQFGGVVRAITRMDKPVIAAVNGPAAGVGLAFALACDIILLSERARLLTAFGRLGLVPEVGTSWLLSRRLGHQRAFALWAAGEPLTPAQALEAGLANAVVTHDELPAEAQAWCERLEAVPAHAVALTKPLLRQAADLTWDQALAMEEYAEPMCFTTDAHQKAVTALLQRT